MSRAEVVTSLPVREAAPRTGLSDFAERSRYEINEAGRQLFESGSLSKNRAFSAAVRLPGKDTFVLGGFTPRHAATLATVAGVGFDGTQYEGELTAESHEIIPAFAAVFSELPKVGAVIFAQSPNITAFALAHRPLPVVYGTGLIRRTQEDIPLAAWTPRPAAQPVVDTLRAHPRAPALLLANRGFLAWNGGDAVKLSRWVVSLEEAASIIVNAELLGGAKPLPPGAHEATAKSRAGA